ncbi:hypothetical protein CRD60_00255 [Bifidobacterium aemilianum]|uniref:Uncharacterized protein n=1 Tax=Bifidobacterium aemilianum TaxID=2493120 RepID=A0A366KCG3_9BIFI|nr:hypothetical protein [Bifidobacterium aemilianum]RBP98351.1 hypothetical protein CRD60_00255 [Bifidobacterium aemilianum]
MLFSNSRLRTLTGYPPNMLTGGPGALPFPDLIMATGIFLWVVQTKPHESGAVGSFLQRLVLAVSPSVLGIYLIHDNLMVKSVLWNSFYVGAQTDGPMARDVLCMATLAALYMLLLVASCIFHGLVVAPVNRAVDTLLNAVSQRWRNSHMEPTAPTVESGHPA